MQEQDSTLPARLRTLIEPASTVQAMTEQARADKEAELRRLARQYFADCAYEDDARLRMFARAVYFLGFRRGHQVGRDEVR